MVSESSSISTTPQDQGDSSYSKKVVDMKEKEQVQSLKSKSKKPIDFVKLAKDDPVPVSKLQEHNYFQPIRGIDDNNNPGIDENNKEEKNSYSRSFSCSFCNKRYSTAQALGGHQSAHRKENSDSRSFSCSICKKRYSTAQALGGHKTAHRKEHALEKHKKEQALEKQHKQRYDRGALGLGKSYFDRYRSYSSTLFTPYNYRSLGVSTDSMIRKPPYNPMVTPHNFGYSRSSLLQEITHHPLVSLRNMRSGNNGVENLGIGGTATLRIEHGTNNKIGAIMKFRDSSTNIATSSNSNTEKQVIVASNSSEDDIRDQSKSNIEEEPSDSSGLDLSLKL